MRKLGHSSNKHMTNKKHDLFECNLFSCLVFNQLTHQIVTNFNSRYFACIEGMLETTACHQNWMKASSPMLHKT